MLPNSDFFIGDSRTILVVMGTRFMQRAIKKDEFSYLLNEDPRYEVDAKERKDYEDKKKKD